MFEYDGGNRVEGHATAITTDVKMGAWRGCPIELLVTGFLGTTENWFVNESGTIASHWLRACSIGGQTRCCPASKRPTVEIFAKYAVADGDASA